MHMQGNEPIGYYASWKSTDCLLILGKLQKPCPMSIYVNGLC